MDISLIKSFLEVARTGSFVAASERLFVTQSAVSLRIQRLEDSLGQSLFTRSKAGAEMTPAGREFERYALSMINIWEEARQQLAIPPGFNHSLTIGAQYSLWPRLGFRWIDRLQAEIPDLNIRAELGMPDRITRFLVEGIVHAALLYSPQLRPGLSARRIMDDELILVAPWSDGSLDLHGRYVFVDWGPEFVHAHSLELPELTNPGLTMSLGAMAAEFIVSRNKAAYLPARYAKRYLDNGQLHLLPDAHRFPYPAWLIWRDDLDATLSQRAFDQLDVVLKALEADQDTVMKQLRELNHDPDLAVLGRTGSQRGEMPGE